MLTGRTNDENSRPAKTTNKQRTVKLISGSHFKQTPTHFYSFVLYTFSLNPFGGAILCFTINFTTIIATKQTL